MSTVVQGILLAVIGVLLFGLSNDRAEHSIKPFAMGRGN